MKKFLNVIDYAHKSHETGVPVTNVNSLYVIVISGDEIITAVMDDGAVLFVDAVDFTETPRQMDFFDGEYGVHKDDLEDWLERKDSYEWFGRMLNYADEL